MDGGGESIHRCLAGELADNFQTGAALHPMFEAFQSPSRPCFGPEVPCSFLLVSRLPTRRRVELSGPGPATFVVVAGFRFCVDLFLEM